jgi:uncharacterized protein (TIGR02145 family)
MRKIALLMSVLGLMFSSFGQAVYGDGATDIDGNIYSSVIIGEQEWMVENLRTSKYNDGTPIPQVTDQNGWEGLSSPAWCWYDNDSASYNSLYGKLYNWHVVDDSRSICPVGWHVPAHAEWIDLNNYLAVNGYNGNEGRALKAIEGYDDFDGQSGNGTDNYGFKGLPGGTRRNTATYNFLFVRKGGYFWSSTESSTHIVGGASIMLSDYHDDIKFTSNKNNYGLSVRCIKNNDTIIQDTTIYSTDYHLFVDTIFLENTDTFRKNDDSGDSVLIRFTRIMYSEAYADTTYVSVEDTLVITMSSDTSTGIDFLTTEVNVYPNPVSTQLNVEIDMSGDYTVSLTNINGQMVFTQANVVDDLQIDISDFTKGLYFITIRDNDGVLKAEERKIVIE